MSTSQDDNTKIYHEEERKNKRKAIFTRIIEVLNYIILPIQYLTKDIFLLFNSYQSALSVTIPALRFISKNLSWLYGVSFILEGLCALIEATRSENEDKRAFLIGQGTLLILAGIALAVIVFTNPQVFLPLLCVVWGASTVMFLYDVVRDVVAHRRQTRHQLKTLEAFRMNLDHLVSHDDKIYPHDNDRILNLIVHSFDKSIQLLKFQDVDTQELRAEIMEKIANVQDKKSFATKDDIDGIVQEIIDSEKFNSKTNRNVFISAAYITVSFLCALATFMFLGKSDITQSAIFSHLLITTGMIAKRSYDFMTNPIIFKAQFENISSKDIDQLSDEALREKYLKKKLKQLDKRTRRLLDKLNPHRLQKILQDYAEIVKDINAKDSQYSSLLVDLSQTLVHSDDVSEQELRQLTLALQQSIGSRMLYLGSNHSCMLCSAIRSLAHEHQDPDSITVPGLKTLYSDRTTYDLSDSPRQLGCSVHDINKQCGKLLEMQKNQSLEPNQSTLPNNQAPHLPESEGLLASSSQSNDGKKRLGKPHSKNKRK